MVNGFLGQDFLGPQPNFLAPGDFAPQVIPQQVAPQQNLGFLGTLGQAFRGENQLFNTGLGIATAEGGFGTAIQQGIMGAANLRRQQEQDVLNRQEQEARIAELGRVDPIERFTPVLGPGGQVFGQRSSTTGRVVSSPLAGREGFIQFQNPITGETRDVRSDSPEADQLAADPAFQQVSRVQRIEQGGVGAFTSSQIGERELNFEKQTRSVAEVTSLIDRLTEQVTETGAPILGIVGAAQRFAGEAGSTINAAADVFGIDLSPGGFNFDDFDTDAVKSARTRSNIVKLSFLIAQARNPSGRITEPDVQAAIREIGASADPRQFLGTLQEVRQGVVSSFNILARQQRQSPAGFEEFVSPLLPSGTETRTEDGRIIIDLRTP